MIKGLGDDWVLQAPLLPSGVWISNLYSLAYTVHHPWLHGIAYIFMGERKVIQVCWKTKVFFSGWNKFSEGVKERKGQRSIGGCPHEGSLNRRPWGWIPEDGHPRIHLGLSSMITRRQPRCQVLHSCSSQKDRVRGTSDAIYVLIFC